MSQLRFLFLEDSPADAELIIAELGKSDFVFDHILVNNEKDFIAALDKFNPDVIFTDYYLPTYNGLEAIKEVKQKHNHIPIIVITGAINEETSVECMKAGASDYVLKDKLSRLAISTESVLTIAKLNKENKRTLELLKSNERTYRTLIEQAGDAIFKGNLDGDFNQVNSAACKLTGFSKEELLAMNMKDIFSENQPNLKPFQYDDLNRGESVINEREIFTKEGRFVPVEMNSKKIDDNSYLSIIRDLSRRKKIEKNLKDHEDRLRNIIEHTSNLFYMQTLDGEFTYISPQTKLFFDCDPEEMLHKRNSFFSENSINEEGKKNTQKAIETGITQLPFELELIGKKGRKIWVEVHEAPVIEKGKVIGIVGALVDITNWKTAYNSLVLNEQKFKKLFSEAPDGIILMDSKGVIIDCNQAYCVLLESSKDKIVNTKISDSICPKDKDIFNIKLPVLIKNGKSEGEIDLVTDKNNFICTRRSASAIYDETGEFAGAIVHTHDISEQKKSQDEIRAREERLSAIFNAADNISFVLSSVEGENSEILDFSPGSENLFGYKKDEVIGKPVKLLYIDETIKNFTKYLDKMKYGEEGFKGQTTMVKKSGDKFPALHTAYPIFDNEGKLSQALGVTIDITENKKLEAQLRHSQKMEAVGLLASGIAHNFNNILQAIVGYIDFAKEGLNETEQRYKDIDQIGLHVKRATNLTKSLLAVGKDQFMEKNEVDLNDIIIPIVDLTNRATQNNIEVIFNPNKDLPLVYVDGGHIDQVIMNIFINARDAMPDGGLISVTTNSIEIDEIFCSKNLWAKPGKYILVKISDTGHGMDSDTKRRILEPYFTTKELDKGTGLGLSTAFGIISQHNGLFNVISEKGKGSTFEIYLPFFK